MAGDQRIARWIACHGVGERLANGLFKERQNGAAYVAFHVEDYTVKRRSKAPRRAQCGAANLAAAAFQAASRLGSAPTRCATIHDSSWPEVVTVNRPCFTPFVAISALASFCTRLALPFTRTTSRQLS